LRPDGREEVDSEAHGGSFAAGRLGRDQTRASPGCPPLRLSLVRVGLLPIQPEGLQDWAVADREEDRLALAAGVLVPAPGRDDERVALFPIKALAGDDAVAATLGHVVDRAGDVAMRGGVLVPPQQLQV